MEARPPTTIEVETAGSSSGSKAREVAAEVGQDAAEQARQVADTAKQQTRSVVAGMGDTVRQQVSDQKNKAALSLRSLSEEMSSMSSERDDAFAGLMSEASSRVGSVSTWIEQHEPQDILRSVEDFARRRPGTFLAGAALAGIVTGRLTRGMMSGSSNGNQSRSDASSYVGAPSYSAPMITADPVTAVTPAPADGPVGPIMASDPIATDPVVADPLVDPVQGREIR